MGEATGTEVREDKCFTPNHDANKWWDFGPSISDSNCPHPYAKEIAHRASQLDNTMHSVMWLTLFSHVVLHGPGRMGVGGLQTEWWTVLRGSAFQGEWCWCWPGELNEGSCVCMGGWKELSEWQQLRKGSEPGDLVGIRRQKNGQPEFMGPWDAEALCSRR